MAIINPLSGRFSNHIDTVQQLMDMGLIDEVQARKMLGFDDVDFQVRSEAVMIQNQEIFVWEY